MTSAKIILLSLLLGASLPAATPPNIIFILADDLGYTDVGCYGSKYYETPSIDRLASQGMKFTSGYTCGPNCQPTRAAMLSGQYMPRTGVYTVGSIDRFNWRSRSLRPVDNVEQLSLKKITTAEALKKAGYTTGLFGKWHLGNNEFHPSNQGFDQAIVTMGKHFNFATQPPRPVPTNAYLADFLTDQALQFMEKHKAGPFFLALHHFGVHAPHEAKEALIEKFKKKPVAGGHQSPVYAAMIASVDESVGRVMNKLDELKLSENTLIIFTSDNGGVGGYEREGLKRSGGITDNFPLRSGKGSLYEGGIRVPYLFRWTGKISPGTVCDEPINSVDLYPTFLEVAGSKPEKDFPLDGRSYLDLLTNDGKSKITRGPLFWHFPGYLGAGQESWRTTPVGVIRDGDWKLMEFFEDNRLELYNLKQDLSETNNLASKNSEKTKQLHQRLVAWRKELAAPMPTRNEPDKDAKVLKARRNKKADE